MRMRLVQLVGVSLTALTLVACMDDSSSLSGIRKRRTSSSQEDDSDDSPTKPSSKSKGKSGGNTTQGGMGPGNAESDPSSTGGEPSPGGGTTGSGEPKPNGGNGGNGSSTSGNNAASDQEFCWSQVNAFRAKINLPPLARWTEAEKCSDQQSVNDSNSGVAHGSFGSCNEFAQNECPGNPGPTRESLVDCLQMMWDEGPGGGHYDNMTNRRYTKVACGVHVTPSGAVWSVQNFR
jgi:hypothetical protein